MDDCAKRVLKRRVKRPFTLIELSFVMVLLLLFGSLTLFQGRGMVENYQSRKAASKLTSKLFYLRHLALTYQADIAVTLTQNRDHIALHSSTNEPLPALQSLFKKADTFNKLSFDSDEEGKSLLIHLFASGWIKAPSTLTLNLKGGEKRRMSLSPSSHFPKSIEKSKRS